jgi:tripartite-type tricarboxylate transporter receptor subunit TctC
MNTRLTCTSLAAGAGLVALAGAAPALAQFPEKPIEFVTPYPPGGSHSLHAGIITTVAEPYFGEPMISVIRSGGGGVVGATEVLQSAPDGYTLLFGDPTINSLRPQVEDLPYTTADFVPVARINYSPAVFVARADAPFDDLESMIAYAQDNPGDLVYSSDNVNGFTYTVFELLKYQTDSEMKGIVYGGGGPAMQQLLGGETMAYAGAPSVVGEHIEAGTVTGICTTDFERWDSLPDVPTCGELGEEIIFHFWRGVLAPAGTPDDVVATLSDGFAELVQDEGFLRLIGRINSRVDFLGHEEFGELMAREQADLKEVYDNLN